MKFRLCLTLGIAHPDALDELLTYRQFCDWRDHFEIEPFGDVAADERLAHLIWSTLQAGKIKPKALDDCRMKWGPQDVFKHTPEEYAAKRRQVMARAEASLRKQQKTQ